MRGWEKAGRGQGQGWKAGKAGGGLRAGRRLGDGWERAAGEEASGPGFTLVVGRKPARLNRECKNGPASRGGMKS